MNALSSFGLSRPGLLHRHGGNLRPGGNGHLAINFGADSYDLIGPSGATVKSLPDAPPAVAVQVMFKTSMTVYHDAAKLITPERANMFVIPGDIGIFVSLGSGVWQFLLLRGDWNGSALIGGDISGLTLSNNVADATNDIDWAAGVVADSTGKRSLFHTAGTTQLDVAYGTGNGGRFDNAISDGWWHGYVISNGVTVSRGFSKTFGTPIAETNYPPGYDIYRYVGSIHRNSGVIRPFRQNGDFFIWGTAISERNSTAALADQLFTITIPLGIRTIPLLSFGLQQNAAGSAIFQFGHGDDSAVSATLGRTGNATEWSTGEVTSMISNTASQIRLAVLNSSGSINVGQINNHGYINARQSGRL